MAQNKRSAVQNFFEAKSANVVVCKLCNVYNWCTCDEYHLKAKHPSGTSAGKAEEGQRTVVKLSKGA